MKGPEAFRTISEAATELGVPQHVLRFWESRFSFIRPMKRAGGRRFYRRQDIDVLKGVRTLLHDEGYTIKGVQRLHKEQGVRRVLEAGLSLEEASAFEADAAPDAPALGDAPPAETPAGISPRGFVLDRTSRIKLVRILQELEEVKGRVDDLLKTPAVP